VPVFQHLAGIDHADQQAREEDEALRVLDEGELTVVHLHHPVAADEYQVVDEHEDEEIAPHAIDDLKSLQNAHSVAAHGAPQRGRNA
jgi:vacuolar-type H+-ATPase subunit F/Vma7